MEHRIYPPYLLKTKIVDTLHANKQRVDTSDLNTIYQGGYRWVIDWCESQ